MELLANAIGTRYYGEDEFHERSKGTGSEQSTGKEERRWRMLLFIEGEDAPGFDSSRRGCHGDGSVSPHEEAVKNERRHAAAWRRRQAGRWL